MPHGVLNEQTCRDLFEWINSRPLCAECQAARNQFVQHDQRNGHCSNLLPGFSSKKVEIPIDILVVAEAHGGGSDLDFRQQRGLDYEVTYFGNYYLIRDIEKFHQHEMRVLLNHLNDRGKTWVFTDLIKCFVGHGADNRSLAIQHCRAYLDRQIDVLRPEKILCLGNTVAKRYFQQHFDPPDEFRFKHGSVHEFQIGERTFSLVFSIFPARNTADLWVENGGWESILPKLI